MQHAGDGACPAPQTACPLAPALLAKGACTVTSTSNTTSSPKQQDTDRDTDTETQVDLTFQNVAALVNTDLLKAGGCAASPRDSWTEVGLLEFSLRWLKACYQVARRGSRFQISTQADAQCEGAAGELLE